jgi:protein-tyrosine phosphatase
MTWSPETPGVVRLPDGRRVRARGLRHGLPAGELPSFGVYLLGRRPDAIEWDHHWIRCRDFGTPANRNEAHATLREAYDRAANERVEIACGGGVGRTGMALAVLAIFGGVDPHEATAWVRTHYHRRAVETPWQRRFVRTGDRR